MAAAAVEQVDDAPDLQLSNTHLLPEPPYQFLISQNKLCVDQFTGNAEVGLTVIASTAFPTCQHGFIQQFLLTEQFPGDLFFAED